MKYLYDLLTKFMKKPKAKITYKIVSSLFYLLLAAVVIVLLLVRINKIGLDIAGGFYIAAVIVLFYCFCSELFSSSRYLHVSHNKAIKEILGEKGVKPTFHDPHGKNVFQCVFENDARVECTYDRGKYTFSVKNDEWDEVQSFTSGDKGFDDALRSAVEYALTIEKLPEGEYDESLEPEKDTDGEEGFFGEDEEDEDGEKEEEDE